MTARSAVRDGIAACWFRAQALGTLAAHVSPTGALARRVAAPEHRRLNGAELTVYEPPGSVRGVIVCVHGISPFANEDPRLVVFARAIAAVGFRVIAPRFPSIAALQILPQQPAELVAVVEDVCQDPSLAPRGRVALLGVSLSGSFSLLAAADPRIADRVSAVCSIGGYTDLPRVIAWLLLTPGADPYGGWLVLANGLEALGGPHAALAAPVREGAVALFHRQPIVWEQIAASLVDAGTLTSTQTSQLLDWVEPGPGRRAAWEVLRPVVQERYAALDPARALQGLRAPVTLLHGRDDNVIPAVESVALARVGRAAGWNVRLEVTPLLSHGDAQRGIAWLGIPGLVGALGGFFADVSRGV